VSWVLLAQGSGAVLGVQAGLEHGVDLGGGEIAGGTAVEHHVERIERALGLPELIGDDADRVVARQVRQPWMPGARVLVGDGERGELHHRVHPGHLRISASLLMAVTCPVNDRAVFMAALRHPGTTTSMPKTALPLHLAGVSKRASGLPMR